MSNNVVYMDYAATTPLSPSVFESMQPYFLNNFANPSSIYGIAREAKSAIEEARKQVGAIINASPKEIYFTSGGTESDNWAIINVANNYQTKGKHLITSTIEHHAVLHTFEYLGKNGYEVSYCPVDADGKVDVAALEKLIRPDTTLISIMFANNEIGTIQPIKEIAALSKKHGVIFHTDAVQAVGHINVDVQELGIDLLSFSSHKLYGPKGVGALYVRKGIKVSTFIHGGGQERNKRAGTENVPSIIGFGRACVEAKDELDTELVRVQRLRDKLIAGIKSTIPFVKLNGHPVDRLPNNTNYSFQFIEGESLLLMLDMLKICGSSGSACTSGSLDPSHVLLAIGLPHEIAHGSLRLTLGKYSTEDDVNYVIEKLPGIVTRLRSMSPLYEDYEKANK